MSTKYLKTILFISIGVLGFMIFEFFGTRRRQTADSLQPKNETLTETTLPFSPRVFRKPFSTPQETLKDFQSSDFYRTLIDNNLFRPLGWRAARPTEPYRLIGTLIPTDDQTPRQAIVQRTTTQSTDTVTIGETLDTGTTVVDIQPKQVTLEKDGHQRTLTLNTTPLLK